eukprot:TRINITY_DN4332_c0_g1_i1.p2 TRINITY_DN4332_c0_g1~~TRINITY_DN4332_c0_g1_i1.p2  ORF type:complete len:54 (-),score=12.71 TRINITY_DN4332_c0_g1_i1:275-436(-)
MWYKRTENENAILSKDKKEAKVIGKSPFQEKKFKIQNFGTQQRSKKINKNSER